MTENEIGTIVIEEAIKIHRELGPGLLESVYETVLAYELNSRDMQAEKQVQISITYRGIEFKDAFKADIIIQNKVILEIKSVEKLLDVHKKQLLTYLKLTRIKLGYILNFGECLMKDGIVRIVNCLEE